ncbi:ATP adenylyltransferase [uncultured bacterium]|nr:ATP adenylyltransferase [uncultured bacterium]
MSCIFCRIVDAQDNAAVIYDDESVMAFLDIKPFSLGHTLVIPKKHFPDFNLMPPGDMEHFFSVLQKTALAVQKGCGAKGLNIVSNIGKAAGQSVFHCHFHLIPRYGSDHFRMKAVTRSYRSAEEKADILCRIRNCIQCED